MKINIIWDPSTSFAPAAFKAAINWVVNFLDQLFTNNITINIDVGWGEIDNQSLVSGALGESEDFGNNLTYSQVRNVLIAGATSSDQIAADSTLPLNDPTDGGVFFVATAEEKALGL